MDNALAGTGCANTHASGDAIDGPHRHLDGVAEPQAAPAAAADEGDAQRVEVDELSGPRPPGQVALEQPAEAHERPRVDHPDDLAGEARIPSSLVQLPLEQEGGA